MKGSIKVVLLCSALPIFLFSAEPSAFGAGNLNSSKPYGLTSNEKVILDTKHKLHKVSVKSNNQANELDSLRERLDGLQSVIESLSRKAHNNKININKQSEQRSLNSKNADEYDKRLGDIVQTNAQDIEKLKVLVTQMSTLIDTINTQYVSKEEFNSLVKDVNEFKSLMAKELKGGTKKVSKPKFTSKTSAQVATAAKAFYDKKYYTNAIENYEYLIKKNYKPAYAHYMIGDMNFRRKNYSNALSYYKKSSSLYSKAPYMPKLMLNSAISMDKTGDKAHAQAFYRAVVSKYPESSEAESAAKHIK